MTNTRSDSRAPGVPPVTMATVPVGDQRVRRRHSTHRGAQLRPVGFRPGAPDGRQGPVAVAHRPRPTRAGCVDPRASARAAAVRRRHILLAIVAVGLLVALAVPWSGRGSNALASPGPTPTGSVLSPHSVYVVQPGDTLWSIAERLDPQSDPRPVMTTLAAQVGGDTVRPGERLLLP